MYSDELGFGLIGASWESLAEVLPLPWAVLDGLSVTAACVGWIDFTLLSFCLLSFCPLTRQTDPSPLSSMVVKSTSHS